MAAVPLILINDGQHTMKTVGEKAAKHEMGSDPLHALFWDPKRPPDSTVMGLFGAAHVASQTIFAETFPEESEWIPYSTLNATQVSLASGCG